MRCQMPLLVRKAHVVTISSSIHSVNLKKEQTRETGDQEGFIEEKEGIRNRKAGIEI